MAFCSPALGLAWVGCWEENVDTSCNAIKHGDKDAARKAHMERKKKLMNLHKPFNIYSQTERRHNMS